jgi:hypothetical protein
MRRPDPVCVHPNTSVEDWDRGRDPETGYRDAGTTVTCRNCGERWTEDEFRQELEDRERDHNPQPGDVYNQLGQRIVVVDCGGDDLFYISRDGSYTGPLRSTTLERFRHLLDRGLLRRVLGSAKK